MEELEARDDFLAYKRDEGRVKTEIVRGKTVRDRLEGALGKHLHHDPQLVVPHVRVEAVHDVGMVRQLHHGDFIFEVCEFRGARYVHLLHRHVILPEILREKKVSALVYKTHYVEYIFRICTCIP